MRPSNKQRSRNKPGNNNNPNRRNTLGNIINRVFESAGPDGKVRGTPQQIIDKYQALARDAQLSGDRVAAESYLQHSEHYSRMLGEAQRAQMEVRQSDRDEGGREDGFREEREDGRDLGRDGGRDFARDGGRDFGRDGGRDGGRDDGGSEQGRDASRENSRDQGRDASRENGREHGRDFARERDGGRERGEREGGRDRGGRDGGRDQGEREGRREPRYAEAPGGLTTIETVDVEDASGPVDVPEAAAERRAEPVPAEAAPVVNGAGHPAASGDETAQPPRRSRTRRKPKPAAGVPAEIIEAE